MSLFKKKIDFSQFVADLICFQLDFLENNFSQLTPLADEFGVLTEIDKKDLYENIQTLAVADILLGCHLNLCDRIAPENINRCVAVMYRRSLVEYKGMPEKEAENKAHKVLDLLNLMEQVEKEDKRLREEASKTGYQMKRMNNEYDEAKYFLTSGFAKYFAGKNKDAKDYEGKHFAAFKMAKAITISDIVAVSLKECKVTDDID
jgi:hypothetical protein